MDIWGGLISYANSLGVSNDLLIDILKFMPVYIIVGSGISFGISNWQVRQERRREKMASYLRDVSNRVERGLTPAEIAKRIAPQSEDKGIRKILLQISESLLKLAKFDRKATEAKLIQAGDRDPRAISRYIIQRGTAMMIAPLVSWLLFPSLGFEGIGLLAICGVSALAGGILVDIRLDRAMAQRKARFASEFPVVLDLLTIYLEAGQAFDVALSRVGSMLKLSFPTASEEFVFLKQDLEISVDREKTLWEFARRAGTIGGSTFAAIVIQSERRGNAIGPSLRTLARDLRRDVLLDIERKAQKIPTVMSGPTFVFILPAIFMSVIGPVIVQVYVQFMVP